MRRHLDRRSGPHEQFPRQRSYKSPSATTRAPNLPKLTACHQVPCCQLLLQGQKGVDARTTEDPLTATAMRYVCVGHLHDEMFFFYFLNYLNADIL